MIKDSSKPSPWAWEDPQLERGEILALKALSAGLANENQQRIALKTIIEKFASTYNWAYRPDKYGGVHDTYVMLGRQFVGQRIVGAINLKLPPTPQPTEGAANAGTRTAQPEPQSTGATTRRNPKPARPRKPTKPDASA